MTVQEPLAGIAPPVKVIVEVPAAAASDPPHVVLALPEISIPVGKLSVNGAVRSATTAAGLSSVIVSVEIAPATTEAGLNALFTVGGTFAGAVAVKVATAGTTLLPLLVCNAPAARELIKLPAAGAVTFTVTVQEPLVGIVPPVNITVELPVAPVRVPPQVVVPGAETVTPVGSESTSGEVKLAALPLALLKVMVRTEVPPAVMLAGLKALLTVGGTTVAPPHEETETIFESSVTAPFCARALPESVAFVVSVMLVKARIFPTKVVPVPRVAELPTCQNTLQAEAPLIRSTFALLAVINVLPILKIKTAFGSPCASRVTVPVRPADDAKQ